MKKKSASPTVRALNELKEFHLKEIKNIGCAEYDEAQSKIDKIVTSLEKPSIDAVIKAIQSLDIPFKPVHTTLCNIRKYNGSLTIELVFDKSKNKESAALDKVKSKIIERRRNAEADLEQWYIKSLYDIAGRSNVTEFKLKR